VTQRQVVRRVVILVESLAGGDLVVIGSEYRASEHRSVILHDTEVLEVARQAIAHLEATHGVADGNYPRSADGPQQKE
jgi:hypothetical protein